ncbi:MAG: barstar family protein [Anaerolineae bacterium]|nr:MAG: barstar family protein [Anaerolineae bacterium]
MKISEVLANPDDAGLYQIFGEQQMDSLKNIVESNGFRLFWLDGNRISSVDQFYDEIVTVLEFPFFGQNFNALYDCLSDLEWLSGKGFVLYYTDYANLLNIAPHDFDTILDVFVYAIDFRRQYTLPPLYILFQVPQGKLFSLRDLELS